MHFLVVMPCLEAGVTYHQVRARVLNWRFCFVTSPLFPPSCACVPNARQERRADKPMFDVVVELEGGNQPAWSVVTAVATVVDELLEKGCVWKPEIRAPLPSTEVVELVDGEVHIFAV